MTEMNKNIEIRNLHPSAFICALLGAPLLVGTAILAPLYALDMAYDSDDIRGLMAVCFALTCIGTFLYLLIGTPVLIYHLRRHAPRTGRIVALSICSVLAMLPVGAVISVVTFDLAAIMFAAISIFFGLIGGPILAAIFCLLYIRLGKF